MQKVSPWNAGVDSKFLPPTQLARFHHCEMGLICLYFVRQDNLGEGFELFSFACRILCVRVIFFWRQSFDVPKDQSDNKKLAVFHAEAVVEDKLSYPLLFFNCQDKPSNLHR